MRIEEAWRERERERETWLILPPEGAKDSPPRSLMLENRIHNCRRNSQIALSKCGVSHDVHQWCQMVSICHLLMIFSSECLPIAVFTYLI